MLFRRKRNLKDRVGDAGDAIRDAGEGGLKKFKSSKPNVVDTATAAALLLGIGNWLSVSLFNFDVVQAVTGKKSTTGRTAYGFMGVSALYAALRGARGVK
jgi:uncharacterized membrane protein YuzA (DUF378 family)